MSMSGNGGRPGGLPGRRSQRGTALVEFALILPFLLVLTLGVVDISRAFYIKNVVHQAAREGARYLVVHSVADSAGVRARVQEVTAAAHVSLTNLTVSGPGAGRTMTVSTSVQFDWILPGLFTWLGASFTNPMTLTATAVMRKEG